MYCKSSRRSSRGGRLPTAFSLVEMMVVLVIIGMLAGIVTLNVRYFITQGKQKAAKVQITVFVQALDSFYNVHGRYPTSEEGLAILAARSDLLSEPLLKQIPNDPWGHAYQYNQPGRTEPFEVVCFGADGREGGEGPDVDLSSSDGIGATEKGATRAGP